jgi:HlyD family secretion protein
MTTAHISVGDERTIVARGRLQPEGGVRDISGPGGERLGSLKVKEGDAVKKGAELARLESWAIRKAELEAARSQVEEAKAQLKAITAYGNATIREAEVRKIQVEEGGRLDIKVQEAKVRVLEAQLRSARSDLTRLQQARLNNPSTTIPQQQVDHQELQVRQLTEELDGARALLEKLVGALKTNTEAAAAQHASAVASLARAQQQVPLDSLTKNMELAEERWNMSTIRAPTDGTVLKILSRPGEALGTQPILRFADTRQMVAIAEVYETDVLRLKPGMKATVASPALGEPPLTGVVQQIGSVIARNRVHDVDPAADADARVIEVKVRLDPDDRAARLINLQVYVTISRDSKEKDEKSK